VRGLAIDQTVEEKNGQRVVVGKTATELVPHQQRRSRFRVFVGSVELIRCLTCLGYVPWLRTMVTCLGYVPWLRALVTCLGYVPWARAGGLLGSADPFQPFCCASISRR
jgi:hypothetical protein